MSIEIKIHSALCVAETNRAIQRAVDGLRASYGSRFWFSEVQESSALSRTIALEDFGFSAVCGFLVSDLHKEFDGLDVVARTLRDAIGQENSIVIFPDSGELFPKEDDARLCCTNRLMVRVPLSPDGLIPQPR